MPSRETCRDREGAERGRGGGRCGDHEGARPDDVEGAPGQHAGDGIEISINIAADSRRLGGHRPAAAERIPKIPKNIPQNIPPFAFAALYPS